MFTLPLSTFLKKDKEAAADMIKNCICNSHNVEYY